MIARLTLALGALSLAACASIESPGGAPEPVMVEPEVIVSNAPRGGRSAVVRKFNDGGFKSAAMQSRFIGWSPVRRAFFGPSSAPPEAAYHVILIAGPDLAGDPRMQSVGEALCGKPGFSSGEGLNPARLALVSAPVAAAGGKIDLAEDYHHARAARWLDTLSGTLLGREAGPRLDRRAFGFIAAAKDPTRSLDAAEPHRLDAADAIYIDLAGISAGYVEEVVDRIVKGMHERNAVSHTGAIGVLEAFSLVERIGAATLSIAGLLGATTARAAPEGEGC